MSDEMDVLDVKVGDKLKIYYNENNKNNCIIHVRAIVDGNYVVYRVWSKYRKNWIYRINDVSFLEMLYKDGYLKRMK